MATLRNMIVLFVDQATIHTTWDHHLGLLQLAYNSSVHMITLFTPFFLVHGCESRVPALVLSPPQEVSTTDYVSTIKTSLSAALDLVRLINLQAHAANALLLNQLRRSPSFQVGQQVLLFTKPLSRTRKLAKLTCVWKGLHHITLVSENRYSLLPLHTFSQRILSNVHAHRLKLFYASSPVTEGFCS
ncbi:hypothetical protein J3Q64DRAFT_1711858 [Phycomyces blakesleeanus]|uniref:Uncharacterized protein n=1 Tax=Phycomyces blakesleeanus TaxID=4837 RepID=A0ABR3BE70_PHYBL